ncbi:MAG: ADP-ribosylglycohydrolase family protein [Xanthomonadales bacterium]|nr:ADP-ribosylglycohydrolase family protein [Xanthomonadales bacterium]
MHRVQEASPCFSRARGALLGLAVGDAVGTTLEFEAPGTFEPIDDLVGGGPFALRPGQWTDDTSMALCLAESLVECGGFDAGDQMERYLRWWREGHLSSTGHCFDIGGTVRGALGRYEASREPFSGSEDPWSAGNGSIMRLAPVPIFYAGDRSQAERYAAMSSRTTHGAAECIDACRLLAHLLVRLMAGVSRGALFDEVDTLSLETPRIRALARGEYRDKPREAIRGTGYVVDSLEASLWCFERAGDYREAVLMAANLGDDADTTAAITGQLAGARWGESGIPADWLKRLHDRELISDLADRLIRK